MPTLNRRLIRPRRWTPPKPAPDAGRTAELAAERSLPTGGRGPEDVIFDGDGRVLAGLADGSVLALDPITGDRTVLGNTGGRPLGLQPCADGSVLVCDHDRGLLRLRPDGDVDVLCDRIDGERITFASNVVQAGDGTIFFTTSTSRWDVEHHVGDMLEHSCTGRLIRVDPDGKATTIVGGLAFGNGLVLAADGSHLLYAETGRYRVMRHWLTGPRAGATEPFAENLAGFPDNMSLGSDRLVWVAIAAPRDPVLDRLLPLPGVLRLIVWNLPDALRPKAAPIAWVLALDAGDGRVVHDLRSTSGAYRFVTSVAERDGLLAIGSLAERDVLLVRRP